MAIRYSGDVEVRVTYLARSRTYKGAVRAPGGFRLPLTASADDLGRFAPLRGRSGPKEPSRYDEVARLFLGIARRWAKAHRNLTLPLAFTADGQMEVRRVFQAPCPVRIKRRWGDGR